MPLERPLFSLSGESQTAIENFYVMHSIYLAIGCAIFPPPAARGRRTWQSWRRGFAGCRRRGDAAVSSTGDILPGNLVKPVEVFVVVENPTVMMHRNGIDEYV